MGYDNMDDWMNDKRVENKPTKRVNKKMKKIVTLVRDGQLTKSGKKTLRRLLNKIEDDIVLVQVLADEVDKGHLDDMIESLDKLRSSLDS